MLGHFLDWLDLLLRWAHIIAAIGWIGSSFFFMWLDASITPPSPPRERVKGELWMVHSGGFYHTEKRLIGPNQLPAVLHWFKYEALFTWILGFSLLWVVYYLRTGMMVPLGAKLGVGAAIAIGVGSIVVAWALYDLIWSTLGRSKEVATLVSLALLCGAAYGLSRVLTLRATYIHVGAILGTIMVANVWMRILPAQRRMIAATKEGREPDHTEGERAKQRSVHNNYMTLPVVFIMISNHFPSLFAHRHSGWVLAGLAFAGAAVRYFINRKQPWALVPTAAAVVALFVITAPASPGKKAVAAKPAQPVELQEIPAVTGSIRGVVRLDREPPVAPPISLPSGCVAGAPAIPPVVAREGRLANAFVSITAGAEKWKVAAAPSDPVVIDQKGCTYAPRVIGARAGQPVRFLNSDALMHNVHAVAESNDGFNLAMQVQGSQETRTFTEPELMVHMKCDVHPWMAAWIGVVAHPWFAVTDDQGEFTLSGVPPGEYTVTVWHEVYKSLERRVTVSADAAAQVEVVFR